MCSHRLLLLLTQSQNCQGNPAKPHSHSLGITPCASLSTLLQNIPSQDTVTTMWRRFACFHVRPFFFDFGGKVHSSISKSPGLKFGPGCCFNARLACKERIQTTSSKSCEGRRDETHGRCKQNVSDCIPDLPGPRRIRRETGADASRWAMTQWETPETTLCYTSYPVTARHRIQGCGLRSQTARGASHRNVIIR